MKRIITAILILVGLIAFVVVKPYSDINGYYYFSILIIGVILILSLIFSVIASKKSKKIKWLEQRLDVWNNVSFNIKNSSDEAFSELPIGIIIYNDSYEIVWANKFAKNMFESTLLEENIEVLNEELFESLKNNKNITLDVFSKKYDVEFKNEFKIIYFFDVTEREKIKKDYKNRTKALVMISLDNYDKSFENLDYQEQNRLRGAYLGVVSDYAQSHNSFLQSFDVDSLLMVVDYEDLVKMIEDKFEFLDNIREISNQNNLKVTASCGIACYDCNLDELGTLAKNAIDLAEKRGGDQVVLNIEGEKIQFFGGKTNALEKEDNILARVNAISLKELVESAGNVLIMGHMYTDLDSISSMIATYKMAISNNSNVKIVFNELFAEISVNNFLEYYFKENPKRKNYFIDEKTGLDSMNEDTLLIIVDTQSPSIVMFKSILNHSKNICVIDHHRSSENGFVNPKLSYVEPYASSTTELLSEMIDFYGKVEIEPFEASIMLAGIMIDTNDFTYRTNARTFDAASFLKAHGADMIKIRKLLRVDFEKTMQIYRYLNNSEIFLNKFVITKCPEDEEVTRVTLAKTSDQAMKFENVEAAFTIGKVEDGKTGISARSYDSINVQIIMEELGGGGHLNNAATQIHETIDEAVLLLQDILRRDYMEGEEKMKVILLEDLKGRGKKNDVIEVASGYATFLLSQKKAIEANQANLDALHQELEKKANEEKMHIKLMQKLKDDIQGKSVQIEIKVGVDGKLFGNVTTKMIADALEEQLGMTIDKRKIEIDKSINSLGIHNVTVDLHKDVRAEFQVHIIKK